MMDRLMDGWSSLATRLALATNDAGKYKLIKYNFPVRIFNIPIPIYDINILILVVGIGYPPLSILPTFQTIKMT